MTRPLATMVGLKTPLPPPGAAGVLFGIVAAAVTATAAQRMRWAVGALR
jgi:hypothetical protein